MYLRNNKLKIALISLVVLLGLIGSFVFIQIGPYNKKNKKDILVEIPKGSTINTMTDILYEKKLIKNKTLFKIVAKVSNEIPNIKSGKYLLNQTYSNNDIIDILSSGKTYQDGIKVTIPEGSTSNEVIDILVSKKLGNKEIYENLIKNPKEFYNDFPYLKEGDITTLEGFLYPQTYYFEEGTSEKEVLDKMLAEFGKMYTEKLQKRQKELKMTLQEVVNLSSIVEKEAVRDEDRPIIASVFYNRLDIGMRLQSDATIQYIFPERKKIVTYNDLKIDSPYNSYKNVGLPPTPIANPSIKSIEAVLYPKDTDYLYFVATMDGGNNYSKTYEEHLKFEKEYKEQRDKLSKEKASADNK
ncbi:endolytic transglycosylase MltG [Romboutsia sp. 1001713B170131_170501_G6]|uniref:endolytic transglycosylase MltG n=1 Tax=Romboutsia sp. 1001713B170131_170501_G6 TaxID=2787108 RepID=UPI0018ABDAA1|nr:endolytic transglycosylase MltG [Romboutsia sp. 1001713B170131_170501_G6]